MTRDGSEVPHHTSPSVILRHLLKPSVGAETAPAVVSALGGGKKNLVAISKRLIHSPKSGKNFREVEKCFFLMPTCNFQFFLLKRCTVLFSLSHRQAGLQGVTSDLQNVFRFGVRPPKIL